MVRRLSSSSDSDNILVGLMRGYGGLVVGDIGEGCQGWSGWRDSRRIWMVSSPSVVLSFLLQMSTSSFHSRLLSVFDICQLDSPSNCVGRDLVGRRRYWFPKVNPHEWSFSTFPASISSPYESNRNWKRRWPREVSVCRSLLGLICVIACIARSSNSLNQEIC
ncbi:hypothetical protein K402DRAFT_35580 [Aulographum hederae CBS 113979]|uniref:Uncharacterized protein n=1 Tax=Aulographum hederae CBS 113979 TaxID=1176131 RepID=A0A6G1H4C4_9PEZI|nr:hypothetical protein K402DRAFT_35580 [Aulographum hederae CBS 113979]